MEQYGNSYTTICYIDLPKLLANPMHWKNNDLLPIRGKGNDTKVELCDETIECPEYYIRDILLHKNQFNDQQYPCTIVEYPYNPPPFSAKISKWAIKVLPTGLVLTNPGHTNISMQAYQDSRKLISQRNRHFHQAMRLRK